MKYEFLGRGVRVHTERAAIYFTAQELIELVKWAYDHEIEIQSKALEMQRVQDRIAAREKRERGEYA